MNIDIAMKVVSEANSHTHWRQRQRRAKQQRDIVLAHLLAAAVGVSTVPVVVTFTRLGIQPLDDDNLAGSFKHVCDEVADYFGVDDGDRDFWTWRYEQEKSKQQGIRINIERKAA